MLILKHIPPFSCLHPPALAVLNRQMGLRQYPKGVVIFCEGDIARSVFIVAQGSVKTYVSNDNGKKLHFREYLPFQPFGIIELLTDSLRFISAMTQEDSVIAVIQKADFNAAFSKSPELWNILPAFLAKDLSQLMWNLKNLALFDIQGRVKNLLIASSTRKDGQMVVGRRWTQQEIADRIGATRERVSSVLAEMKKVGLLDERNGYFVLTGGDVDTVTV